MNRPQKHIHIPLFIPHQGCPNQCVFCDQHTITGGTITGSPITGTCSFASNDELLTQSRQTIEAHLTTIPAGAHCEIAFFGGSFTGLDRGLMTTLLDLAEGYVRWGKVAGIRMSTRPDYIDEDILDILSRYTIAAVELGIQSMDDGVLSRCRRGHKAADTEIACDLLRESRIPWVGQMMIGLPGATPEAELRCAEAICRMGAVACRIYPTIVLHHTELAAETKAGAYIPLTVEEAVERSSAVLEVFLRHGVTCLRIGLCDSEALHDPASCMAGPVHPAMGELVGSRIYRRQMERMIVDLLAEKTGPLTLQVSVPQGDISMALGQKRANKIYIEEKYPVKLQKFVEKQDLMRYNILLENR